MTHGGRRSMVFTPPPADVRETRAEDVANTKPADPEEAVLLYGRMLADVEILTGELQGLLFAGTEYRSKLRVVRSASKRLGERAARLLGEE